jgi:energy-coupling factor transporter ATP-binding protein EcfA2
LLRKALKNQLSERKDQKLLQELARRQRGFFTTDKTIAENYAGTDGHLYSLDLKDSDLSKIYGDYNNLGKANQALVLNVPHELANKARLVDKTAAADPAQTILITGHSGSGKSTLGKLLGKKAEATHELKSSNIRAVGYDKENKKLEVAFHSGGNYTYNDVPKSLFDRIRRVKSPGKFFHKHIKRDNSYSYERMGKESEYKFHWSKDLHRDVTNNRHYPFSFLTGEAQELVDAVKNRDWPNFKEEIGDTTYAAQMLAAQATGLNHPVYADLSKHYGREKVWKDMFREKGSTYHPKHMEGGSNYAKASKIIKAFASAGIKVDQREAERLANKYTGGKMEKEAGSKIIPPHIRDLMIRRSQGDLTALEALRNIGRANAAKRARLKPINDLINRTSEPVVVQPKPIAPVVPMEEPVRLDPEVIRARFDEMRRALGNPGQNQ